MLEVDYLRRPAFSGSLAVAFAAYFGVFSIFFLTALYLQVVLGYTATTRLRSSCPWPWR